MDHYTNVKEAIENASKGQTPLTIDGLGGLAHAIAAGLEVYGNHKERLVEVAKELLYHTGDVYSVTNISEENEHLRL